MKYAVIFTETTWHGGDERSRTSPGHGYPAHQTSQEVFKSFENVEGLKAWILANETNYGRKKYKAIKYEELAVSTEVIVNI